MRHYPKSSRQLRAEKDRRGILILGGCALFIAAGGAAAFTVARSRPRDKKTSCLRDEKPALQTYVIVDRTDPWSATQTALLKAAMTNIANSVNTEERLTLIAFDGSAERPPVAIFDQCKTPDGSSANPAFQNPFRVEKDHQETFVKPFEETLTAITTPSRAKETHLVAFISNLAAQIQYEARAGKTRIVIFSDMAENTPALSVYAKGKSQFSSEIFARYFASHMHDRLSGISFEFFRLPPPGRSPDLEARIKNAWSAALSNNAIDFSMKDL